MAELAAKQREERAKPTSTKRAKRKCTKAKAAPPPAKPGKPARRGGNRSRFPTEPLKLLMEQNPGLTREQLQTAYQQVTGIRVSFSWIKVEVPKLRQELKK
jgi:hypothetical protein